jgi:hypothetical protein
MSLEWKWGKPDCVGVWFFGGYSESKKPSVSAVYLYEEIDEWAVGWWCYGGSIPEILEPKKYRTPKLPDDYGKECEFSDDEGFGLVIRKKMLTGYYEPDPDDASPWMTHDGHAYKFCRIEVKD